MTGSGKAAPGPQLGAQCQQHIKHHAHTGDGLAFKSAAGLVGVHDDVGIGQPDAAVHQRGQVVVGHQHLQAQRLGAGHAVDAGDAVVHGEQHVGTGGFDAVGDRCGQAVAVHHAVGHQIADALKAEQLQAAQRHSAGGGAVAVIVGHHADVQAIPQRVGQQHGGLGRAQQAAGRQQPGQAVIQFIHRVHAPGSIQLRQQRVNACLFELPDAAGRHVADVDFHGWTSNGGLMLKAIDFIAAQAMNTGISA